MNNCFDKSKWIWYKETDVNQYVDFRCDFNIDDTDEVYLHISIDSRYAVYVNGKFVPAFQYADYPEYKVYDSIDISSYIGVGNNSLVIVGYYQGVDSTVYRLGEAGLIFAITNKENIVTFSDKNTLCRQSLDYTNGKVEKISEQLSYSFRYNMANYDGFRETDYKCGGTWQNATEQDRNCELFSRPIKQMLFNNSINTYVISQGIFKDTIDESNPCGEIMQTAFLGFCSYKTLGLPWHTTKLPNENGINIACELKDADGIYLIIDLGREETGIFDLDIELYNNTKILIGYGEHLEDMRVRTSIDGRQFAAVFNGKAGRNRFTHTFKRFACRYVSLHIYANNFKLYYAGLKTTPYPLIKKENINNEEGIHKQILDTCIRTLELCVHEHYEDCPWREQGLYAMDSQNQMLFGYSVFNNPELPKASLKLLALGQKENGLLELCAPARICLTIPAFSLCFISALKEYVENIGDVDFISEMLPYVEKVLNYFLSRIDDTGLVPFIKDKGIWNFYEWSDGLSGGNLSEDGSVYSLYDAPLNAFLLMALNDTLYLLNAVNSNDKFEYYSACADKLKVALKQFYDEDKKLFASYISNVGLKHYGELTQCLMVCANVLDDSDTEKELLDCVAKNSGSLVHTTLSCTLYKYKSLLKYKEFYSEWIKKDIENIWGKMLYHGATSFWETEIGANAFDRAGSLCHGWSAVPIYYYFNS